MNVNNKQKLSLAGALLFSLIVIGTSTFIHPKKNVPKVENKETKKENLDEPNEWFYLQRSYPDEAFDIKAYHHSLQGIQDQINSSSKLRMKSGNGWHAPWTTEGPGNIGGRINCVTVHPTNHNIIYLGNSTGGIFKSIDGGLTWNPIFDVQSYLSIGCITFEPGNPNTIYAGTGDPNITGSAFIGNGIYKSVDSGTTWTHLGLSNEAIISKIIIHPTNHNIIYAATMGMPFFHDNNRGLYKSTDGGVTWNNILFVSDSAGIIDLVMDFANPNVLYAASWNRIRNNHESSIYGPDAKIWKTINGGTTWTALGGGLPTGNFSRISLSMSGLHHNTLFASYSDTTFNLYNIYKTIDSGVSWSPIPISTLSNPFNGQGWYSGGVHVNPTNDNELWLCGVDLYKTTNGGNIWSFGAPEWWQYIVHGDMHDVQFTNASTIYLTTDGGAYKTTDNGNNWTDIENIPNNQFYHITYDPFNTGIYAGGVQDNGTTNGNASSLNNWGRIYGGDGFGITYHPTDPTILYAETQNGGLVYSQDGGLSFYDATFGINPNDVRNWDMQYIMSSADPNVLYTGTTKIYQNSGGPNVYWQQISNDLIAPSFSNDPKFHTISCLAESSVNSNNLYTGTSDGYVWRSIDAGGTWTNVTGTLPDRYVTCVKASQTTASIAYVSHSGYKDNDFIPHIHKTINNGNTWTDISGDLPQIAVNCIMTYSGSDNILFIGTDGGVYGTVNGGVNWIRIGNNMPVVPTYELSYDPNLHKLLAGTFGRSLMSYPMDSILLMTGITAPAMQSSMSIYPNPTTDFIKIHFNPSKTINAALSIINTKGDVVRNSEISFAKEFKIPVNDLASGIYFIKLEGKEIKEFKRFVKL